MKSSIYEVKAYLLMGRLLTTGVIKHNPVLVEMPGRTAGQFQMVRILSREETPEGLTFHCMASNINAVGRNERATTLRFVGTKVVAEVSETA